MIETVPTLIGAFGISTNDSLESLPARLLRVHLIFSKPYITAVT